MMVRAMGPGLTAGILYFGMIRVRAPPIRGRVFDAWLPDLVKQGFYHLMFGDSLVLPPFETELNTTILE